MPQSVTRPEGQNEVCRAGLLITDVGREVYAYGKGKEKVQTENAAKAHMERAKKNAVLYINF